MRSHNPIAIFDSGFGSFTLFETLKEKLPNESLLFLSDSANLPYGSKSKEEIIDLSLEAVSTLNQLGIKLLIIGCHTASIHALDALKERFHFPVIGIHEVFQQELTKHPVATPLLLGTQATIESNFYQDSNPSSAFDTVACDKFVSAVESGLKDNKLIPLLLEEYLQPYLQKKHDTLLLACTHFPFLEKEIHNYLESNAHVVDPTELLIDAVKQDLQEKELVNTDTEAREILFYTTGDPARYAEVGSHLINEPLTPDNVFEIISEEEDLIF